MDIINRPVLYLKLNASEIGFRLRLQMEPTDTETKTSYIDWAQLTRIHLKTEIECSFRNVMF
jgi:hypothetical protein